MAKLSLIVDSAQAEAALRSFVKTADGVTIATTKTAGGLEVLVKKLAAIGLAYKTYNLAKEALSLADSADRASRAFNVAFGGMADKVRAWVESTSRALKMHDEDLMRAASSFKIMFENMGVGADTAATMSQNLTELGAKLTIVRGLSADQTYSQLESGMMGNNRALRELNITLNDTLIEQYALDRGWISQGQKLSQAGRAYTILQMVMEQTAKVTAGLAGATQTYGEQQRQLTGNLEETKKIIGTALQPAVTTALTEINAGLRNSQSYIKRWASDFVEGFLAVRDAAKWVADLFKPAQRMPDSYRQGAIDWYRQVTGDVQAFERTTQETGLEGETVPKYMAKWQQLLAMQRKAWEMDQDKTLRQAQQTVEGLGQAPPTPAAPEANASPAEAAAAGGGASGAAAPGTRSVPGVDFYDREAGRQVLKDLQNQQRYLQLGNAERQAAIALDQANVRETDALGAAIAREARELEKMQRLRNMADDIGQAFGNAFETLVFEAGKAREAVNALLMDIARAITRRMITEPLVNWVSTGIMGWLGGGTMPSGADLNPGMATVAHGGGVIGYDTRAQRAVAPWLFLDAPRYHTGLFPNEERAILQKGETVLPAGSRPNVTVNITNNSSAPVTAKVGDIKLDLRRMVVGIVLEDQQTNGPISRGLAGSRR